MALAPDDHRPHPRLSAGQLADYLAATSMLSQMSILRGAKYPTDARPLMIQYQHARKAIAGCLATPSDANRIAAQAIISLEQKRDDPASRPLIRDDARRSIEVIRSFQSNLNALGLGGIQFQSPPPRLPFLVVNGVEVSVFPDVISRVTARTGERVGEVFIRCTIGGDGDAAENRRADANAHLATIAHMHSVANLGSLGTPYSQVSLVIDVPRSRVTRGPVNTTLRVRNIETACSMIAAIWPTV
jgi:hypothetical protein